jgi:metal-dependent amidase/aminoacylase/carboxypeptidase family protein
MAGHREEAVNVKVEARRVNGSSWNRTDPRIKRTIRKIIEEVKGEGYTVDNGRPDKDKDLGKEVSNGTL